MVYVMVTYNLGSEGSRDFPFLKHIPIHGAEEGMGFDLSLANARLTA